MSILVSSKGKAITEKLPTDITFEVLVISPIVATSAGAGMFSVA